MSIQSQTEAQQRAYLRGAGFLDWEVQTLTHRSRYTGAGRVTPYETLFRDRWTYSNPKEDPATYLQRMIQSRRHNVRRWKKAGLTTSEMVERINKAYRRHKWLSVPRGTKGVGLRPDPFAMLEWFRGRAIAAGQYIPPAKVSRPGSHHDLKPGAESRERQRLQELYGLKPSAITSKRDAALKVKDYNQQITRAISKGDQRERRRLSLKRDQWQSRWDELRGK